MAGRIKFYKINRKIHFFTSIVIFTFSLLYIVTGFVMTRHDWFPVGTPTRFSQTFVFNGEIDTSNLGLFGEKLREDYDLSGRMNYRLRSDGAINYNFNHPGKGFNVWIPAERDSIYLSGSEHKSFGGVSRQFHHLHGYSGGLLFISWAVIYDITAVSFILFAISGIVIWFRRRKSFRYGWYVLIGTFLVFLIVTIALLK